MSFLSSLFGGNAPKAPSPVPAAPVISSGQVASVDREQTSRLARRAGTDATILTKGLGDVGSTGSKQQAQAVSATLGGTSA